MAIVSLRLPDSLHEMARIVAKKERISINQLVALAIAEKLSALETEQWLEERAARGNRAEFERVLSKVPDVAPAPHDRLPQGATRLHEEPAPYVTAPGVPFSEVWQRIVDHAGQTFHQVRGKEFRYAVAGDYLRPDTTNQNIAKTQFEEAFRLAPLTNTTEVQHLRGPSYIYAILMDKRIRRDDW